MGSAGQIRWHLKNQSPLQAERHTSQRGRPAAVALAPFPPAGSHHAPAARLLHLPLRQDQDRLLPHQRQGHVLPAFHQEQDCEYLVSVEPLCRDQCVSLRGWGLESNVGRHNWCWCVGGTLLFNLSLVVAVGVLHSGSVSVLQRGSEGERQDGNQAIAQQWDVHGGVSTAWCKTCRAQTCQNTFISVKPQAEGFFLALFKRGCVYALTEVDTSTSGCVCTDKD